MPNLKFSDNQRVLLVNAPNSISDYTFTENGNYGVFPALGVISLGTRLKKDYPNLKIKVLDGGIFRTEYILREIDKYKPSIICISVLTPTYKEGLKIAEYAKKKYNSITILGNDHANFFPRLILEKRPFIDYVIKSEIGEPLLSHLVGKLIGEKDELVSSNGKEGIFYRTENGIKRTYSKGSTLSDVYKTKEDIPDINLIKEYFHIYCENYNKRYKLFQKDSKIPMTINIARGCVNCRKRCLYCSIYNLSPKRTIPEFFWWIIEKYNLEYKVNFFFEVADEFLTFQTLIKELIKTKPFDLREKCIEMEIYARADNIVNIPESILLLKELNITRVNLGLDSGDNTMLEFLRKNYILRGIQSPSEINYQAVKLLAENGITIHASFPIGCIGETYTSLKNTLFFIKRIANEFGGRIATLESSEFIPLPNSPAWDILLSKENSVYLENIHDILKKSKIKIDTKTKKSLQQKYSNQDLLNLEELSRDWIKYFTHISWTEVENTKKEIKKIDKKIGAVYGTSI